MTKIFRARLRGWSWKRIASWSGQPLGIEDLQTLRSTAAYKTRAKRYAERHSTQLETLL